MNETGLCLLAMNMRAIRGILGGEAGRFTIDNVEYARLYFEFR